MATKQTHRLARLMMAPSVAVLLLWMIVPLALTIWFSFQRYRLTNPNIKGFAGLSNFEFFVTDPAFWPAIINTLLIVVGVLVLILMHITGWMITLWVFTKWAVAGQ